MIDTMYQILAKFGFNEPLHPPITHMPIGLTVGALIFLLVAIFFKKKNLVMTARHVSILAFIFAFPTIILGVIDWIHFYHAALITPIKIKMVLAVVVLIVLGIGIIVGSEVKTHSVTMTVLYSIAFVSVIGLGYFGSGLIYGRGVEQQPQSQSEDQGPAVVSASGQAVFTANCQGCHPNGGNIIVPKLSIKSSKKLVNKNIFIAFLRDPKMPDGSSGQMPPFSAQEISDTKAGDLYDYIITMIKKW